MKNTEDIFSTTNLAGFKPQNEQEAWIAVMHACIAVDEHVADEELDQLSETLADKALFEGHDVLAYSRRVFYAQTQLGSKEMIDRSVDWISPEHKEALFSQTVQLVLSDGVVQVKEADLIKYLYSALDMEEALAHKIIDELLAYHKRQHKPQA